MDPRAPPQLDPDELARPLYACSCRTPQANGIGYYQVARGAPLFSPTSPMHSIHSGNPNISLEPTPGRPDTAAQDTSEVVCPACLLSFDPLSFKEHTGLKSSRSSCARARCSSSSSGPAIAAAAAAASAAAAGTSAQTTSPEAAAAAAMAHEGPTCDACGEHLSLDGERAAAVHFMANCQHVFSTRCLGRHVRASAGRHCATPAMILCPAEGGCDTQVAAVDLLCFLSQAEHDALLANELNGFLQDEAAEGYTTCPGCNAVFELVDPSPTGAQSACDLDGRPLTREQLNHYRRNRLRCPHCALPFCSSCRATPYHTGFTCSEHKELASKRPCRFCDRPALSYPERLKKFMLSPRQPQLLTCGSIECDMNSEQACAKTLACGHPCPGILGETTCPPCFIDTCPSAVAAREASGSGVLGSSWCSICYAEELRAAPCLTLACGHVYHSKCVTKQLLQKWPGARISFQFMNCPQCSVAISHPALKNLLRGLETFRKEVRTGAALRLKHEGRDKDEAVTSPQGAFYKDLASYAEAVLAYYQCYVCERPYFGGLRQCDDVNVAAERYNPAELVCAGCVPFRDLKSCRNHGTDFIEYKCKFCCSVAQWFCWGTTHFCITCHRMQERGDFVTRKKPSELPQCTGRSMCPLRVDHPQNGTEEFALGCAVCRMSQYSGSPPPPPAAPPSSSVPRG